MVHQEHSARRNGPSRSTWVLVGFLAIAAYFLLSEHRAHFLAWLPFLLLLACPLLHFLLHGHGGHGAHGDHDPEQPPAGRPHRPDGDSR
jgi:hypothetical protein